MQSSLHSAATDLIRTQVRSCHSGAQNHPLLSKVTPSKSQGHHLNDPKVPACSHPAPMPVTSSLTSLTSVPATQAPLLFLEYASTVLPQDSAPAVSLLRSLCPQMSTWASSSPTSRLYSLLSKALPATTFKVAHGTPANFPFPSHVQYYLFNDVSCLWSVFLNKSMISLWQRKTSLTICLQLIFLVLNVVNAQKWTHELHITVKWLSLWSALLYLGGGPGL